MPLVHAQEKSIRILPFRHPGAVTFQIGAAVLIR